MKTMEEERAKRVEDIGKGMTVMVDPKLGKDKNQDIVVKTRL